MEFMLRDTKNNVLESKLPNRQNAIIDSHTPIREITIHLTAHGCKNLTSQLDPSSLTTYPISTGGFGDVYQANLFDKTRVAVKTLRLPSGTEAGENAGKMLKRAARELYVWSKCCHRNVLPLLGLVEFQTQLRMASLWMDNGSLPSYLAKHPNINRHDMSTQVCNGLAYLHKNHIVHGDMKGSNILVSKDGIPMINDFGNAVLRSGIQLVADTTQKHWHTPQWTAPELMDGRQNTNTLEADIYSLGMTILEIITGKIPYSEKTNVHAIYVAKVMTKDIPLRPEDVIPSNQYGNSVWSLLKSCWLYEPEMRPKASQVAEDMKKAQGNFVMQKWQGEIYYSLQTKHDRAPVQLKFNVTIQSEPDLDIGLNRWPQKWATTAGFIPMTRATATRLYSSNLPTGHLIDPSHVAPGYSNYAMFRKIIMAGHSIFYADPRLPTIEPGSARGVIFFSIPNDPNRIFLKAFIKHQCPAELCRPGQTFGLMCPKDGVDTDGYRGIRKLFEQISRPASI